jgi:hypothetical protein
MVQTIKIKNKSVCFTVEHRKIKHPRLELKTGKLVVIAPEGFKNAAELVNKHGNWVVSKSAELKLAGKNGKMKMLNNRTRECFEELVRKHIRIYSDKIGCSVNAVFFRPMTSKWGSCGKSGNITINMDLSKLPDEMVKYIVHHEVLHRKIREHKEEFFSHVKAEFINYRQIEKELLEYWFAIKQAG